MTVLNSLLAVLIVLISLIYWYIKRSFSYWSSRGVPHNKPTIPHGSMKGLGKTVSFVHFTQNYYMKFRGTSKLCGLYFFTRPIALLLDLDLIKTILVKEFAKFSDRSFYYNDKDDPLSGHLVALDGVKWKNVRQKLTSTFSSSKMKYMFPTITAVGDRLTNYLNETIKESSELEMKNILARFTMDVIGTCAFGIECDTLKDIDNDFYRMGRMAIQKPRHNQRIAFLLNDFKRLARFLRIKTIRDDVTAFFMGVTISTIDYREKNNIQRNDFMDLLIKLKNEDSQGDFTKGLTVNQIAAQSFLFFVAGYETSSTTMLFALYELALNQEVQSKLRREIQNALKKHGNFSYEMMMDIPYLDQTIQETLRKYPPFTTLRRMAQNDFKVPGTNIVIEKGVSVVVPVYAIQRDPELFPEPEKFSPERFTPEQVKNRHPMAWLAFGEGPRNCIALRFGMMQTRIGLITLLTKFEFSPCEKTLIPMVFSSSPIVLSPKDGLYLAIKPITTE
ncbi:cytochrome P450 6A1-like [Sitodiplosis mosellana]|uniref:cytochrome P450 6A1-like n=1 Tax=Sitodiplosis mosellana TaxID=263140 RepID=UPI002443821B|nr:cytochrome P450 6A1-like [Sitodiplosis mosellana]